MQCKFPDYEIVHMKLVNMLSGHTDIYLKMALQFMN